MSWILLTIFLIFELLVYKRRNESLFKEQSCLHGILKLIVEWFVFGWWVYTIKSKACYFLTMDATGLALWTWGEFKCSRSDWCGCTPQQANGVGPNFQPKTRPRRNPKLDWVWPNHGPKSAPYLLLKFENLTILLAKNHDRSDFKYKQMGSLGFVLHRLAASLCGAPYPSYHRIIIVM